MLRCFYFVVFTVIFSSCSSDKEETATPVTIVRFEQELVKQKDDKAMESFLKQHLPITKYFYEANPSDTSFIHFLRGFSEDTKGLKVLFDETEKEFGDVADLEHQFGEAFANIKKHYPDFKAPKIVSTVSGLAKDIYVSDSLIVLSLDAFIGKKATFRPDQPAYILRRYQREYIVPTVLKFFANKYNKIDPKDPSLMADMVFYGKAYEFVADLLPNTPDSLILGYTDKQTSETWESQDLVWAHFVEEKLLYETNPAKKDKYITERPVTTEIGSECPGRIGQWLGWRIVNKYRSTNPSLTLPHLMNNTSAREIFEKSGYKGQKE